MRDWPNLEIDLAMTIITLSNWLYDSRSQWWQTKGTLSKKNKIQYSRKESNIKKALPITLDLIFKCTFDKVNYHSLKFVKMLLQFTWWYEEKSCQRIRKIKDTPWMLYEIITFCTFSPNWFLIHVDSNGHRLMDESIPFLSNTIQA